MSNIVDNKNNNVNSNTQSTSIVNNHINNIKLEFKHGFGYHISKLDPIISYSALNGDKDYSDRLILKIGKQVCIYNPETKKQEYFDRPKNFTDVTHFAVSSNNRFLSMCELVHSDSNKLLESTSYVSVYSLNSLNRLKMLSYPTITRPFVCSTFCGDVKLLAALSDEPDRQIVIWQWEKERVFKTIQLNMNVNILRSAPSVQHVMLTTSGNGILRSWCVSSDGNFKPNNFLPPAKESAEHFIDHIWMPSVQGLHKMAALGEAEAAHENAANRVRRQVLYIFEGRDNGGNASSNIGAVATKSTATLPIAMDLKQTVVLKLELGSKIEKLCASSKVLILVGSFGLVATYERTDDKHDPYVETRRISVGEQHLICGTILFAEEKLILLTKYNRLFTLPLDTSIEHQAQQHKHISDGNDIANQSIASSLGDDRSLISISEEHDKNMTKITNGITDLTPGGYHTGNLLAADLAYERPLLVTIGTDNTARVWNYSTFKCELTHNFEMDEPIAIAFHSSGFQVLVSFKDRIRLYNVMMDKLRYCKETILKNSKCLKFSNGGQYWAAASAVNVCVYETKSFQQLMNFQGHMMTVVRLCWAPGDQVLFSAGMDGNVYGWPIAKEGRLDIIAASNRSSLILDLQVDSPPTVFPVAPRDSEDDVAANSSSNYTAITTNNNVEINNQSKQINMKERYNLIVSSLDGNLRMPNWSLDNVLVRGGGKAMLNDSYQMILGNPNAALTAIQISADRTKLYAGTSIGTLRIYAWPPESYSVYSTVHAPTTVVIPTTTGVSGGTAMTSASLGECYYEVFTHGGPVVSIQLSPINNTIVSASADGSIFILEEVVISSDNNTSTGVSHSKTPNAINLYDTDDGVKLNDDVVLMAAEDMEEHISELINIQKELIETKAKHEFHSRKLVSEHADYLKLILDQHEQALNKEREASEHYKTAAEKRIADFINSVEAKDADNQKIRVELENKYEHKLAESLERYDTLSEKMQQLKQKCEGLLENEKNTFNKQLNDMRQDTQNKEKKLKTDHRRAVEDKTANEAAFMEILRQQEDEYEDELKQMIESVNFELASEREIILKLRTLVQTKNTKLAQLKKKLIELNASAAAHAAKVVEEVNARKTLLATIEHYKKNLKEREEALAEKEKDVLELRSTTRTLENFRFVLDHRLQQLSSERGPITMHIEGLEKHISTMYEELVEEFSNKKANNEASVLKDQKIAWITQDLTKMRQLVREKEQYITAFKRELNNIISSMIHGKELEESVKLLYRKFVRGETDARSNYKVGEHIVEKVNELMHSVEGVDDHTVLSLDSPGKVITHLTKSGGGGGHSGTEDHHTVVEIEQALIETAKESDRQKIFVEKQSDNIKHRLQSVKAEAHSLARRRLNENSNLLFECNDLRMETKELARKLAIKSNELDLANRTINMLKSEISQLNTSKPSSPKHISSSKRSGTSDKNLIPFQATVPKDNDIDNAWVVHNALSKPSSPVSTHTTTGNNNNKTGGSNNATTAKKVVINSYSAPNLNQRDDESGMLDLHSTNYHKTTSTQPPPKSNHTKMIAVAGGIATSNTSKGPVGTTKKNGHPQSATEWQVDKLSKEVSNLAMQLDESLREKEQQRLEISRLRKQSMSLSSLNHNRQQVQANYSDYPNIIPSSNSLHLPSITSSTTTTSQQHQQQNSDSMVLDPKVLGNNWKDPGGRAVTNADIIGEPSLSDKQLMRLSPTNNISSTPKQGIANSSNNTASIKITKNNLEKNMMNRKKQIITDESEVLQPLNGLNELSLNSEYI